MANLSDIQKSLTNDAVGELVDSAEFTGVTSYGGGGGGAVSTPNAYGSVSGYSSGSNTPAVSNVIDKYPFSADANATDVGDLTYARYGSSGANSSTHGYAAGGRTPVYTNGIEKFPFSADGNATDVGDLTAIRAHQAGASSSDNGYASGGVPYVNTIFKFPFATDGNSTDIGDLRFNRGYVAGVSSDDNGYVLGGRSPSYLTTSDKFSFASDGNATASGNLYPAGGFGLLNDQGQNSSTYGYLSGGRTPLYKDDISKMPFASESTFSFVGNLLGTWAFNNGQSSTDNGYVTAGYSPVGPGWAAGVTIQKFPFSSDTNATDVGDLSFGGGYKSGNSY